MKTIDKVSVLKVIAIAVAITLMLTITMVVKTKMMMEDTTVMVKATMMMEDTIVMVDSTMKTEDTTVMVKATKARTISLDKNGTTGCKRKSRDPQVLAVKELTDHGSFEAERAGFEPAVEFPPHSISSAAPSAARSPLRVRFPLGISKVRRCLHNLRIPAFRNRNLAAR